ncbi:MAG: protein-tyrosine phosphatase family protein [Planctomycetota bacterium]
MSIPIPSPESRSSRFLPAQAWVGLALALFLCSCLNFHAVEEGKLYRSAQPSAEELDEIIDKYDIQTLLFLRIGGEGREGYDTSSGAAEKAGVDFVWRRMSARRFPSAEELLGLWETFENAEYPMLLHCRGGSDRSGLASAIYFLHEHDDLEAAKEQLAFWPYMHTGLIGTFKLRQVLDMYEPYHGVIPFPRWVRDHYNPPPNPRRRRSR